MTKSTDTSDLDILFRSAAHQAGQQKPSRRTRRRRALIVTVTALSVIVALVSAAAAALFIGTSTVAANVKTIPAEQVFPETGRPAPAVTGAQNILFLASDSRGAVQKVGVTDAADSQRSDVIMLVHLPADRKNIQVMSIMRDSWVDIPGHGMAKVNAALAWGGTPLVVATIEQLTGARIDHVAIMGFNGFTRMTDALGGVTVPVAVPFRSGGYDFPVGDNTLNGPRAFAFVHERYAFRDGDYQRVRNEQAFLRALAHKALAKNTLTNVTTLVDFLNAATKDLSVDEGFTVQKMIDLGISMRDLRADDIRFFTMPTTGTGMEGDQSVVYLDPAAVAQLQAAFAANDLSPISLDDNSR